MDRFKKWWRRLFRAKRYMYVDSLGQKEDDFYFNDPETLISDYKFTFGHERGKRVFAHMKAIYGYGSPSYKPGVPTESAGFWDGQKSVVKYIDDIVKRDQFEQSKTAQKIEVFE